MKSHGRASVAELVGDLIVYRNLSPCDQRLPGLSELRSEVGLPAGVIPRKSEPAYACVIVQILQQARALEAPDSRLRNLVFLGDTQLNDGTAFANICQAGSWPGIAFIGSERDEPARIDTIEQENGIMLLANRWAALAELDQICSRQGAPVGDQTVVIIDLDKTTLGARGRNDRLIDQARVEAVQTTVAGLLGDSFDQHSFTTAYDRLNQVELHPFTTDNQDYLAYICLILGCGAYSLEALLDTIGSGRLQSFSQLITEIDSQVSELPASLVEIHREVYACVRQNDPTPFKAFRRNEYRATVERMGQLSDAASADELLANEIVITQEVREVVLDWRRRGALLMALSDKPDEASTPPAELAAKGWRPIHQVNTHAVGE
jgi:hypothetical protein